MSEVEISEEQTTAVVRDRARKPAGLLPKNTQAMVIATISLIMVGAIAFSGGSSPKASGKSPLPPSPSVVDVNQARIAEYRERLDEQARKLAAEQAQFQQAKQQFPSPSAQGSSFSTGSPEGPAGRSEDQNIEDDRKKRAYLSLFSSNVALSYRKGGSPGTENGSIRESLVSAEPAVRSASVSPGNRQDQDVNSATPQSFAHPPEAARDNEDNQAENPNRRKADTQPPELSQSEGKLYRLFEGTLIETVLTNRLNGSFVGPVNCMVTANLYSHDGQQMLIPQGTRVLGEVKRVTVFGQERFAVVFHRLIMPDGYAVSLDRFRGLSQMGET